MFHEKSFENKRGIGHLSFFKYLVIFYLNIKYIFLFKYNIKSREQVLACR